MIHESDIDILNMLSRDIYFAFRRDSAENRLMIQKTIYLLQAYGMKLGYGFSWYKYGPYSQEITKDSREALVVDRDCGLNFGEESIKRFNGFKKLFADFKDVKSLELVASVDFICVTWNPQATKNNIVSLFKKYKQKYFGGDSISDKDILMAFDIHKSIRAGYST